MVETTRARRAWTAVATALVLAASTACAESRPPDTALPVRTVQAGAVEVTLTPLALTTSGAHFRVVLDTHTVPLDLDVAAAARLRVNFTPSGPATWDGAGPGGHHREGTLRFTTPVPAGAAVELRITGLPVDAVASWEAP